VDAPPSLSLVIPAYNEAARIDATLTEVGRYLAAQPYASEIILVDDGSTDATGDLARSFAASAPRTRVVAIPHGGKAAAVRAGMRAATGDLIGFADADLATPLHHLDDLRQVIAAGCDVAIGSREGHGARRIGEPLYRHVMGRAFNRLVRFLLLPGIQDTQCGFKLFRRAAAQEILRLSRLYAAPRARTTGPRVTAFDVELLVVARRRGYRICTVPVVWTYGEQSKVNPVRDTWYNLLDVLRVRVYAWNGFYD
jgi:dolichyl-phosphate beta-glucosyltransferase